MEPSRSRLPLLHHFSLLASLCSARWRDDSRGFLWYPAPRPPRRGPLAIVVYAHDETAMSLEQEVELATYMFSDAAWSFQLS
jgi:hypothetical protein